MSNHQIKTTKSRQLYLGNYGYNTTKLPLEVESMAADWIEVKLRKLIKCENKIGWATEKLKILSTMLIDHGNEKYIGMEIKKIIESLNESI